MIIFSNNKQITLNDDQVSALKNLYQFLRNDKLLCCLSGSAGTGKTTIIKEAIKDYYRRKVVTATTHKAKRVISNLTGIKSETIHSLLGLRPDVELDKFSSNNMMFSQLGMEKICEFDLVIVDEASMINKDLYSRIKEQSKLYRTKIIFIGDPNQLPPVNDKEEEKLSQIFLDSDIEVIRLTKIERQKDSNPLYEVYNTLLDNIDSPIDCYPSETNIINNEGIGLYNSSVDFSNKALEEFSSNDYKHDSNLFKILSFENQMVCKWNNLIRKNMYFDYKNVINVGEVVMAYTTIRKPDNTGNLITNSHDYKIVSINKGVVNKIDVFFVSLLDVDLNTISKVTILDYLSPTREQFIQTERRLNNIAKNAPKNERSMRWKMYFNYKQNYLLVGDLYSNTGEKIKKDFDFSYAITIHKSQGSTYKNVFLDERDIVNMSNNAFKNRLRYVALTRPTNISYVNTTKI